MGDLYVPSGRRDKYSCWELNMEYDTIQQINVRSKADEMASLI